MSFSMQKLRSLLPGQHAGSTNGNNNNNTQQQQRHSVSLEPEIGFQITIEASQQSTTTVTTAGSVNNSDIAFSGYQKTTVPELNVHLLAARHLPALFGFKVVQGYLIKVKLFPGSKRLDSSIQTNSWPKFNENFKFPLAPDIKPSLKHSARRGSSKTVTADFTPEELFAGQFVVFTVYALLELPPASFNRFNKTYRSLRDKSSNLMQKVVESSSGVNKPKDDKDAATQNTNNGSVSSKQNGDKRKSTTDAHPRDAIPPLTISESRRNIGSVTCYLEPKIFHRNARTGLYTTEELWLPIKDITTTIPKNPTNNLSNSAKGVVEIILELQDLSTENCNGATTTQVNGGGGGGGGGGGVNNVASPQTNHKTKVINDSNTNGSQASLASTATTTTTKNPQWNRMTSEVKRKMGISGNKKQHKDLVLRVITARMRCSNKVKDELEATAGSVYVKTSVFEHGIYVDAWKSTNFYPSLSTKWNIRDLATLTIPLQSLDDLDNLFIRTTLATKTKMAKKLVLGTVFVGPNVVGSGAEQFNKLREVGVGEPIAMWHCYQ